MNQIKTQVENLKMQNMALREAAIEMLKMYVAHAESGDAGFWDAEEVPQVIALRKALKFLP